MRKKILQKKPLTAPNADAPPDPGLVQARIAQAAARALAEAAARRAAPASLPPERGGRPGPEPTRYGDWEKKGMICDF